MKETEKTFEVIVDHEWIYEGNYETALKIAESYWIDPDCWGSCSLMSADEFYGCEE